MDAVLQTLDALPPAVLYLILGLGAAIENVMPPVPADTFVVLGGFLAARSAAMVWGVFWVTWAANCAGALTVYGLGYRHGQALFAGSIGRRLLDAGQMERLQRFYDRWGVGAIFITRFLPGLRAVVPVFAGVSRQGPVSVALPILLASAAWYGALVWLGATAGRNIEEILTLLRAVNRGLLGVAVVLSLGVAVWWRRSRRRRAMGPSDASDES